MEAPEADLEPGVLLRPPAHRVSERAILYWTLRALVGWVFLAVGALVLWLLRPDARGWLAVGYSVAALAAVAHLVVMPRWRYRVHRWETTSTAVYTQAGWLRQERRIAPVSRIQTVDIERGPVEHLFRLANVTVTTASAAGPLQISGLDQPTAERLVAELTEVTAQDPGDAT